MGKKTIDYTKLIHLLEIELKEKFVNLSVAFENVAKELGCTPQGVANYWYGFQGLKGGPLKKTMKCFFMKSSDENGPVYYNTKVIHRNKLASNE